MAGTTATIEISKAAQTWLANFEMLRGVDGNQSTQLNDLRAQAIQEFGRLDFPSTKHEEWKYTSLRNLVAENWTPAFRPSQADLGLDNDALYAKVLPNGFTGDVAVLVNGHFDANRSRLHNSNIEVKSLSDALSSGHPALNNYGKIAKAEGRATVALNTAIARDGIFVNIPKKVVSEETLYVIHLAVGDNVMINSRSFFNAEDFSNAKIVNVWHNWSGSKVWENHVSEVKVGVNTHLDCSNVQNNIGDQFSLISFCQAEQEKDSTFRSNVMTAEGEIVRNDLQALHLGENCQTFMSGLTLLNGNTHVDHHTLVDHAMPNCYSNENYKTVLDGQSTCVFNGKVMVRIDAQKTNAFQSNKTLLLSEGATVNTKPQLEIYADDVKCSHGATTGQLDETALFYLRSRGLSQEKAKSLLTYAFGAEVLEDISTEALKESLEAYTLARLGSF